MPAVVGCNYLWKYLFPKDEENAELEGEGTVEGLKVDMKRTSSGVVEGAMTIIIYCIKSLRIFIIFLGYLVVCCLIWLYFFLSAPDGHISLFKAYRRDIVGAMLSGLAIGCSMYELMRDTISVDYLWTVTAAPCILLLARINEKNKGAERKKDFLDTNVGEVSVNGEMTSNISARQTMNAVNSFIHKDEIVKNKTEVWKTAASTDYVEMHAARLAAGFWLGIVLRTLWTETRDQVGI